MEKEKNIDDFIESVIKYRSSPDGKILNKVYRDTHDGNVIDIHSVQKDCHDLFQTSDKGKIFIFGMIMVSEEFNPNEPDEECDCFPACERKKLSPSKKKLQSILNQWMACLEDKVDDNHGECLCSKEIGTTFWYKHKLRKVQLPIGSVCNGKFRTPCKYDDRFIESKELEYLSELKKKGISEPPHMICYQCFKFKVKIVDGMDPYPICKSCSSCVDCGNPLEGGLKEAWKIRCRSCFIKSKRC